jgi:uncharacterized protein (DUF488 family)
MTKWWKSMPPKLFTIGHSTYPLDRFLTLLASHSIELLADIRRFPGSRTFPHFNQDNLASKLLEAAVEYRWIEALGGRRCQERNGSRSASRVGDG